ncbi:hypothetical protein CEUSTIGMA_g6813.t1 [Chlamydomonas eustigma]|uniref:DUF455 domain-containing protein n=1 Tax=Chlamydomonas eustigma TaxID=1157962 RepID=A0A250X8F7_9CHLO|nr:hypothetical protein CEUSTIGMA_g6813.t1 [Chlamydomonas eustigma]|eukprot:GAX79371.1 hypothetical protein CEUSTIGMA_g6813.t1 [Chlamydomonas eustigma]
MPGRHLALSATQKLCKKQAVRFPHDVPTEDSHGEYDWPGLRTWRASGLNFKRGWGEAGPTADLPAPGSTEYSYLQVPASLVEGAVMVLSTACPRAKAAFTHITWKAYSLGKIPLQRGTAIQFDDHHKADASWSIDQPLTLPHRPSRPLKPILVAPKQVYNIPNGGKPLPPCVQMLHNLAHIELNAIDLAWDTVARFAHLGLPAMFYEDFARVADDESRHLGWCLQRLEELGHDYGDMPAHDLLWEGAQMSSRDVGARLVVIPMSQEARGLDAGPRLVEKMTGHGDKRSAAIVGAIAAEEKAHVAVGVAWFRRVCNALELPRGSTFRSWISHLCPDLLKGNFNHAVRNEVGLPRDWYDSAHWPPVEKHRLLRYAEDAEKFKYKDLRHSVPEDVTTASRTPSCIQLQLLKETGANDLHLDSSTSKRVEATRKPESASHDLKSCSTHALEMSRDDNMVTLQSPALNITQLEYLNIRLVDMLSTECNIAHESRH